MKLKNLAITGLGICAAVLLAVAQMGETVPTGSWGLHFTGEGQTPSGPAPQSQLDRYDAAYIGDTSEKVLYLTFDAGYENGYTEEILDTLAQHDVPAAFFLVGSFMERNADLVRQMVEQGHIVANHTAHHPDMSKIAKMEDFQAELSAVETLFTEITGKELPKFYRPPQGVYSESNLEMAKQLGYKTVFWSLAYADWDNNNQPTPAYAMGKLLSRTHPGAVVLLHSTSKTNAQILDDILTEWKNQGYRFQSIDRLFAK